MSEALDALTLPLHGSRLIEASAGTGKTWTITALMLRLVLGHGTPETRFERPLLPNEILVMTFTRAATRELSDRIRVRLLEAMRCFRGETEPGDAFLQTLLADYPAGPTRDQAAWRLAMAAETMDEAAVFTIDAWCQRMLREHAFDSGNLFEEELLADESELFGRAVRDYWRQQVYPLDGEALEALLAQFSNPDQLGRAVQQLLAHAADWPEPAPSLAQQIAAALAERRAELDRIKQGWADKALAMQDWLDAQQAARTFKTSKAKYTEWLGKLGDWSRDPELESPALTATAWERFTPEGMNKDARDPANIPALPSEFVEFAGLQAAIDALPALKPALLRHAAASIRARLALLKKQAGLFSFADMLARLDRALSGPNGEGLRERIVSQYPLALVDEFQDTSPLQYRIFDRLYRTAQNDTCSGLFLIGDPKQSIYAFRGADIHSYLAARRATRGRHYALATNFRSTTELVTAVNQVFMRAESDPSRYPQGAFRFRTPGDNPLPFEPVAAKGREARLVTSHGAVAALTLCHHPDLLNAPGYLRHFAERCAEEIVGHLNDPQAGFVSASGLERLKPANIAVLVRSGKEAEAVRRALRRRGVASVYLSDKDSVFASAEARDLLRLLSAVANPLDTPLLRAALATTTLDLSLAELDRLNRDDQAWDGRVEQFKALRTRWQRQGVLALVRQVVQEFGLAARLLAQPNGERVLTNWLHLAELLQAASQRQEGEQALLRWLADEIDGQTPNGDENIVRLESDADLVRIVTVHKSKGLEYALVYLPFACSFRPVEKRGRDLLALADGIDFSLSREALARADAARLQEDLRLFYVALTRARHALWLGVAAFTQGNSRTCALPQSAFGYLLAGGESIDENNLAAWLAQLQSGSPIVLAPTSGTPPLTRLAAAGTLPELIEASRYGGQFERDWSIGSFSALTRDLPPGGLAGELRDDAPAIAPSTGSEGWHGFPRGPVPGNFLHDQLEWLANEGFRPHALSRLGERCTRIGWGQRAAVVTDWLTRVVQTPLPPLGCALADLGDVLTEMEFWFPVEKLESPALDTLCRDHLWPGRQRPALPERVLHGMLKGFADLVFEHHGRYWVLDYKSNALGDTDAAYHADALARAMCEHRYDVQATLYLFALHRLLQQRLGNGYQPHLHLGGAIYLFLRGINGPETGCCLIAPPLALLAQLDRTMQTGSSLVTNVNRA